MRTFWRLLGFLKPFLGEVALSIFLGTGTVAASIGLMGTSAYLISSAAMHPSIADLQVAIVGVRFFGISRGILRYFERLVSHSVNFRLLAGLRVWFYQAIEPLAPGGLEEMQGGDLLDRAAADIEALENFYVRALAPPVTAMVITTAVSLYVGQYSAMLGWVLAAGMVVAGMVVPMLTHALAKRFGFRQVQAQAKLSAELVDGIQGLADISAFGQTARSAQRVNQASEIYEQAKVSLARAGAFGAALGGLCANLTMYVILLLAIPMVQAEALDGIALAILVLVTLASFEAVSPLSQAAQFLESTLQSARRLFQIADRTPDVQDIDETNTPPLSTNLHMNQLFFRYSKDQNLVLDNLDLDIPSGKRIALVGPSGAGKSSLAGILARLYDCPVRTIFLDGRDIRDYALEDIHKWISFSPQPVYLFSGTLRENLELARPEAGDMELNAVVKTVGLDELLERLPDGLAEIVGSQGDHLSGGERQRVAVGRILLSKAQLLILDEPTGGLDSASARNLMQSMRVSTYGRGLIMVTHRLSGLEWFDEIVVLKQGRVVERGTHDQLIALDGWFKNSLDLQNRLFDTGEL